PGPPPPAPTTSSSVAGATARSPSRRPAATSTNWCARVPTTAGPSPPAASSSSATPTDARRVVVPGAGARSPPHRQRGRSVGVSPVAVAVAGEELPQLADGFGLGEVEALREITGHPRQGIELLAGLDPF